MNKHLQRMLDHGLIPDRGGVWIDAYNQRVQEGIAGTILAGYNTRNMHFITDNNMNENKTTKVIGMLDEGKWAKMHEQSRRVYSEDGIAPTIHTCGGENLEPKIMLRNARIRKLTPRECFRLFGLREAEIDTIQAAGISNTQQYKMAGNSIVVDVLYHIFRKLLVDTKADPGTQLELF